MEGSEIEDIVEENRLKAENMWKEVAINLDQSKKKRMEKRNVESNSSDVHEGDFIYVRNFV